MSYKIQLTISDKQLNKLLLNLNLNLKPILKEGFVFSCEGEKLGIAYKNSFKFVPGENRQQATKWLLTPTSTSQAVKFLLEYI